MCFDALNRKQHWPGSQWPGDCCTVQPSLPAAPEARGSWHRQQGHCGGKAGKAPVDQQQRLKVLPHQGSRLLEHGNRRAAVLAAAAAAVARHWLGTWTDRMCTATSTSWFCCRWQGLQTRPREDSSARRARGASPGLPLVNSNFGPDDPCIQMPAAQFAAAIDRRGRDVGVRPSWSAEHSSPKNRHSTGRITATASSIGLL